MSTEFYSNPAVRFYGPEASGAAPASPVWEDVVISGVPDYDPNACFSSLTTHGSGDYTLAQTGAAAVDGIQEGGSYNINPPSGYVDDGTWDAFFKITLITPPPTTTFWWGGLGVVNNGGGGMAGATQGLGISLANNSLATLTVAMHNLGGELLGVGKNAFAADYVLGEWLTDLRSAIGGTTADFGAMVGAYYSASQGIASNHLLAGNNNSTALQFVVTFGTFIANGPTSARVRLQYIASKRPT